MVSRGPGNRPLPKRLPRSLSWRGGLGRVSFLRRTSRTGVTSRQSFPCSHSILHIGIRHFERSCCTSGGSTLSWPVQGYHHYHLSVRVHPGSLGHLHTSVLRGQQVGSLHWTTIWNVLAFLSAVLIICTHSVIGLSYRRQNASLYKRVAGGPGERVIHAASPNRKYVR